MVFLWTCYFENYNVDINNYVTPSAHRLSLPASSAKENVDRNLATGAVVSEVFLARNHHKASNLNPGSLQALSP
jgi:hypothetical protein